MTALGNCKTIFTVFLHRHSPKQFTELRQKQFERECSTVGSRERYSDEHNCSSNHRYNDIAGFAEVYWDGGTRILIELFFRGDRRTRYGRTVTAGMSRARVKNSRFYSFYPTYAEAGGIPHPQWSDEQEKRQAIMDALEFVRRIATENGCFVDISREQVLLAVIDINRLYTS
jgi:hypothetical protein